MKSVKNVQPHADQKKQRELQKNNASARQQRQPRLPKVPRRKHPLHHQLIRPMRSHRQKCPAQHASPERIALCQIQCEVKHLKFTCSRSDLVDLRPSPRNMRPQGIDCYKRTADIDRHLHHIGPDHRSHSALKRIQQRQRRNNPDRQHIPRTDRDAHHDTHRKHPHSFRSRTRQQKQSRSDLMQRMTEALIDQLIRGQHLALKVFGQKNQSHHNPAQHIADHDLQKSEISRKRHARDADDGQRTGLRGDNRQRNRPPRNRLVR